MVRHGKAHLFEPLPDIAEHQKFFVLLSAWPVFQTGGGKFGQSLALPAHKLDRFEKSVCRLRLCCRSGFKDRIETLQNES